MINDKVHTRYMVIAHPMKSRSICTSSNCRCLLTDCGLNGFIDAEEMNPKKLLLLVGGVLMSCKSSSVAKNFPGRFFGG